MVGASLVVAGASVGQRVCQRWWSASVVVVVVLKGGGCVNGGGGFLEVVVC